MKIDRIIEIANKAYNEVTGVNDDVLLAQWDEKARKHRPYMQAKHGQNDGLARFIVVEIAETYEPEKTDAEQLETAWRAIFRVEAQVASVKTSLSKATHVAISKAEKKAKKQSWRGVRRGIKG